MEKDSLAAIGLSQGLDLKWYGTYDRKPDGSWNRTSEKLLQNFAGSGHPIFRCTSALERTIKKQRRRKDINTFQWHYADGHLRESAQFCGAVADMIEELPVDRRAPGNPLHHFNWINKKFLLNLLSQDCKPLKSDRETCCKNTSNNLRNYQKTRSYPDCPEAGLRLVEVGRL